MTVPEAEHLLVREVYPELVAELVALLVAEGEVTLALSAHDMRLVAPCGCGDDFCQSFKTAPHPDGRPYGPGHRCVPLLPSRGMLVLDAVDGRIVYVEVLDRPPLHDARLRPP
ncbi:hypothetical protein [Streptomyces sp. NRRL WC-3742]|uniref:hypothetical protein n=1 Tax=Streptomyces sp. NRRL WC-3742 TaxID=1463934 RepID=UPI000B1E35AC|nr:hypothetical protein [Streptomyces sp. NRRL WC-3742]